MRLALRIGWLLEEKRRNPEEGEGTLMVVHYGLHEAILPGRGCLSWGECASHCISLHRFTAWRCCEQGYSARKDSLEIPRYGSHHVAWSTQRVDWSNYWTISYPRCLACDSTLPDQSITNTIFRMACSMHRPFANQPHFRPKTYFSFFFWTLVACRPWHTLRSRDLSRSLCSRARLSGSLVHLRESPSEMTVKASQRPSRESASDPHRIMMRPSFLIILVYVIMVCVMKSSSLQPFHLLTGLAVAPN